MSVSRSDYTKTVQWGGRGRSSALDMLYWCRGPDTVVVTQNVTDRISDRETI